MPSIENQKQKNEINRSQALETTNRILIENKNIIGSISLTGSLIDDITFKNYKESLNDEKRVIFLNPKNTDNGYYIETGWAASGNQKLNLPNNNTIWKIVGNNKLTPNNPVTLEWDNNSGIIFTFIYNFMENIFM